ncbi:hypothetical protein TNCV_224461 [Trichonephila clavipes]|nr:hypothetical protein TNCV_224461 [Trichonephila clavipes]
MDAAEDLLLRAVRYPFNLQSPHVSGVWKLGEGGRCQLRCHPRYSDHELREIIRETILQKRRTYTDVEYPIE